MEGYDTVIDYRMYNHLAYNHVGICRSCLRSEGVSHALGLAGVTPTMHLFKNYMAETFLCGRRISLDVKRGRHQR